MSNYNEQFLKQNPLAVLGVLRDLKSRQVPLHIFWSGGQFISKILAVSPDELIMDFGSQEYENQAVQRVSQIPTIAETREARVEFALPQPEKGGYQQLPAFILSLPPSLQFAQRRGYFRIGAPLHPPYRCTAKMPDNSILYFRLFDLSLGGMDGLLEVTKSEGLAEGMRFSQVELNMEQWGMYHADAQPVSISERKTIDGKNETITTSRLSFRSLNVGPAVERNLQRIIFSLEREARERSNKMRE